MTIFGSDHELSLSDIPLLDKKVWGHPSEFFCDFTPVASKFAELCPWNDAQLVAEFFDFETN